MLGNGETRGDTCHVDVVDRHGTMVSATPSGGWLQSSPTVPSLGFCLGSRAQMMWLEDGLPTTMAGGVRPRTTLSPSLVTRDGDPYLAFGTPGGDQQDQWQLAFLLAHLHGGLGPAGGGRRPDVPHQPLPVVVLPAPGGPRPGARRGPAARGDRRASCAPAGTTSRSSATGRSAGCRRSSATGLTGFLHAAANPRGMQGYAVGR